MGMPTHEDAKLLLQLFELRQQPALLEAERWFWHDFQSASWPVVNARYPAGSPERLLLTRVLEYWEMVGALIDHNLLNEDLLFDTMESTEPFWSRLREWLPGAHAEGAFKAGENIEILITRQRRWHQLYQRKAERL